MIKKRQLNDKKKAWLEEQMKGDIT